MSDHELTWAKAIQKVLAEADEPMNPTEIVAEISAQNLRKSYGATPVATVAAHFYSSINKKGAQSPYRKVGPQLFILAEDVVSSASDNLPQENSDNKQVVSAFGMYWRRDRVDFEGSSKLTLL